MYTTAYPKVQESSKRFEKKETKKSVLTVQVESD